MAAEKLERFLALSEGQVRQEFVPGDPSLAK